MIAAFYRTNIGPTPVATVSFDAKIMDKRDIPSRFDPIEMICVQIDAGAEVFLR